MGTGAAVDRVTFEVEQGVSDGVLASPVPDRPPRERTSGGALDSRAGQTQEMRRPDKEGLQGYVSRHLETKAGWRERDTE